MAEKKVTKREVINSMLENEVIASNAIYKAYLANELELLDRKAQSKGTSKTSKENAEIKNILLEELAKVGKAITITDLMNQSEVIKNYVLENGNPLTNQKISALFKIMISEGAITKVTDKKKSYFTIAE